LDLDETLKVAGNSSFMENSRTSDHLLMLFEPATVYVDGPFQGRCIVPQLLRPPMRHNHQELNNQQRYLLRICTNLKGFDDNESALTITTHNGYIPRTG
jgi:hypothetical protein